MGKCLSNCGEKGGRGHNPSFKSPPFVHRIARRCGHFRPKTCEKAPLMSDAKRILTVSYGAFSCTLEGFADPMATLKDVTEHFQSLAALSPNFGSIPAASPSLQAQTDSPRPKAQSPRPLGPQMPTDTAPQDSPLAKAAEVSVSRLIKAADTALDNPETKRRSAALAQTKALVLAKMAEPSTAGDLAARAEARRRAFQQDLAQSLPAPLSPQAARRRGLARS
jgi:hypothetical protein